MCGSGSLWVPLSGSGWLWVALDGPRARSMQAALDGCGWLSIWVALGVAVGGWPAPLAGLYKAFPPPDSVRSFRHFLCTFDPVFQEEFRDKYGRKTAQFSAILLTKNDQKNQTLKAFITVPYERLHGLGFLTIFFRWNCRKMRRFFKRMKSLVFSQKLAFFFIRIAG